MEKFEIPEGKDCCKDADNYVCPFADSNRDYCRIYQRGLNLLRRCSLCLLDHPHGAVIKIENKEG